MQATIQISMRIDDLNSFGPQVTHPCLPAKRDNPKGTTKKEPHRTSEPKLGADQQRCRSSLLLVSLVYRTGIRAWQVSLLFVRTLVPAGYSSDCLIV